MGGIAKAKANGVYRGRKPSIDGQELRRLVGEGLTPTQIGDTHEVTIPQKIVFRLNDEHATVVERKTAHATLDELASAVVYLDEDLEELTKIKSGLLAIQKRAHRRLCSGSARVHQALGLAKQDPEVPD